MIDKVVTIPINKSECEKYKFSTPITGIIGIVENLQKGLGEVSFSLGKSVVTIKTDDVPEFLKDGARIEIDFVLMTIKHLA